MRIVRSLILALGVPLAAAGCAQRPVAYVAYAPAAPAGIDNVVYGSSAPAGPAPGYAARGATAYARPAYPYAQPPYAYARPPGRGIFTPAAAASAPGTTGAIGTADAERTNAAGAYPAYAQPANAQPAYAYAPGGVGGYGAENANFAPAPNAKGYMLDSGDRLRIVVFGQEALTNSYVVGAGGSVDLPLIGPVTARGATTEELARRIAAKLRNGFIREPHVAVEIEAYRPFFILGEVTAPGQYPYVANMTVETAVAIAGGFGPRAARDTAILTRNYEGRQVRMAVPLTFPLRPGDTVNVRERWF